MPPDLTIWHLLILRPRQNSRHFADDTFNRIFVNANIRISIKFSLKFVPRGRINNIPALVQIMAWRRPGDKTLSEPVMVSLLTHICLTRPQWVKCHRWTQTGSSLLPEAHYWSEYDILFNFGVGLFGASRVHRNEHGLNNLPQWLLYCIWIW